VITSEHSPSAPPAVTTATGGASQAAAGHNWYPALSRCACGLRLPNAQHWTDHLASIGIRPAPALPLVHRL